MFDKHPILISFEGVCGSGKSSLIDSLKTNYFQNNTSFKRILRITDKSHELVQNYIFNNTEQSNYSDNCRLFIWWLARKLQYCEMNIENYDILLYDRYYDSTFVYTPYMTPTAISMNFGLDFLKPDITFYLRFDDLKESLVRNNIDYTDPYETVNLSQLENIQSKYDFLYNSIPERCYKVSDNNIHIINANLSKDDIYSLVSDKLNSYFNIGG